MRINGVSYTVHKDEDGNETYDPPLPDFVSKEWDRRRQEGFKDGIPKLRTSATFHAGRGSLIDQLGGDEAWAEHIDKEHRKRTGKGIGSSDVYISQLAKYPGDPDAVFDAASGYRDQDRAISKLADFHRKEPVALAPDLVDELEVKYRQSGDTSPRDELRAHIVEKHGQKL